MPTRFDQVSGRVLQRYTPVRYPKLHPVYNYNLLPHEYVSEYPKVVDDTQHRNLRTETYPMLRRALSPPREDLTVALTSLQFVHRIRR